MKNMKNMKNKRLTGLEPWTHAAGSMPEERLSGTARERILNAALRSDHQQEALPSLFAPARRLWLAGALPLALALLFVTGLERGVAVAPETSPVAPTLRVSKLGDQVHFALENGKRSHKVVRSTDPRPIVAGAGLEMTDGAYAEGLQDGANLVFYRID